MLSTRPANDTARYYDRQNPRHLGYRSRTTARTLLGMVTLHIEHPITDYEIWRAAFDSFADARRTAGVIGERVTRPVDDAKYIVVGLDFDSAEKASEFRHFLETQVWSSPAASPGLEGQPRTAILQPA